MYLYEKEKPVSIDSEDEDEAGIPKQNIKPNRRDRERLTKVVRDGA